MSRLGSNIEGRQRGHILLLAFVASLHTGCDTAPVELGVRRLLDASLADARSASGDGRAVQSDADVDDGDDSDDQNEEGRTDPPRPCIETAQCNGEEPLCNTARGICVECLRDADCTKPNERCEADGECEGPE